MLTPFTKHRSIRHKYLWFLLPSLVGLGLVFAIQVIAAPPPTCTVTAPADSGLGTLRACMHTAKVGTTIDFALTTFPPTNPVTITLAVTLPVIITDQVSIDASNAGVILDGSHITKRGPGLHVKGADGIVIRGLQIINFNGSGIVLERGTSNAIIGGDRSIGKGPLGQGNLLSRNTFQGIGIFDDTSHGNRIEGNYIGTDLTGIVDWGNGQIGVLIHDCAYDNRIGGTTPSTSNLISGNDEVGIHLESACTTANHVIGNFIGVDASGLRALGNKFGVTVWAAQNNQIGGSKPGEGNLISGNQKSGITLQHGATHNQIAGNRIGTDRDGISALGNGESGIVVAIGASDNLIGGASAGERNLISGNPEGGIQMQGVDVQGNRVIGNYIGVNQQGTASLCNCNPIQKEMTGAGIQILFGAHHNFIGGTKPGEGNLISGNGFAGLNISGSDSNQVQGNIIGPDVTGRQRIVNGQKLGIMLENVQQTLIGGQTAGARNLISGHNEVGIDFFGVENKNNQAQGNYIGVDITGSKVLSNTIGILVRGQENLIGGPGTGNLISGNITWGVNITGDLIHPELHSTHNQVQGNLIGTDATGRRALGNGDGVQLGWGAVNNLVGGDTPAERNLISGNQKSGVAIGGGNEQFLEEANDNQVQGNYIGTDMTGQYALGNQFGVSIYWQASRNIIGGLAPGEGNVISGNGVAGVGISPRHATDNTVLGNRIGVAADGVRPVPNGSGIMLGNSTSGNTIGISNTIAHNRLYGIYLYGARTSPNEMTQNAIYANGAGEVVITPTLTLSPTLKVYDPLANTVTGNACRRCRVELFANPDAEPGGRYYLGSGNADRTGAFTITLAAPPPAPYLTALATERRATSAFSNALDTQTVARQHCTVTSAADSGRGSLRYCLQHAQIGTAIDFAPTTFPPTNPVTISLALTLPPIITDLITLDGSAAGVILDGSQLPITTHANGLVIVGAHQVSVRGLQVIGFPGDGIVLRTGATNCVIGGERDPAQNQRGQGNLISGNGGAGVSLRDAGTAYNRVQGNYIGTESGGDTAWGNAIGVTVARDATDNLIGGDLQRQRNLISGNRAEGILLQGESTRRNRVQGNYIGVDSRGAQAVANAGGGVTIQNSPDNKIGGIGLGNLISGNGQVGVLLQGAETANNYILGNSLGVNITGTQPVGNQQGILVLDSAHHNQIGQASAVNLISGNHDVGIGLTGGAADNWVGNNYIGTDVRGGQAVGNGVAGIQLKGAAHDNVIGSAGDSRNLISGNHGLGIELTGADVTGNWVYNNYIGVNISGTLAIGNWSLVNGALQGVGVLLSAGAHDNNIGSEQSGEGNLSSNQEQIALMAQGESMGANQIVGNRNELVAVGDPKPTD